MACVLGRRTQELDHCAFSVRCARINSVTPIEFRVLMAGALGSYLDGGANHPYAGPNCPLEYPPLTRDL